MLQSWFGIIRSLDDALCLVEAARTGLLPRVTRRLTESERKALIHPGAVFIFEETEAQVRRWADSLLWSSSRMKGHFLVYTEINSNTSPSSTSPTSNISPSSSSSNSHASPPVSPTGFVNPSSPGSHSTRGGVSPPSTAINNPANIPAKALILKKKSLSLSTNDGQRLRLISYYREADVKSGRLPTVDSDARLVDLYIPDNLYWSSSDTPVAPSRRISSRGRSFNSNTVLRTNDPNLINTPSHTPVIAPVAHAPTMRTACTPLQSPNIPREYPVLGQDQYDRHHYKRESQSFPPPHAKPQSQNPPFPFSTNATHPGQRLPHAGAVNDEHMGGHSASAPNSTYPHPSDCISPDSTAPVHNRRIRSFSSHSGSPYLRNVNPYSRHDGFVGSPMPSATANSSFSYSRRQSLPSPRAVSRSLIGSPPPYGSISENEDGQSRSASPLNDRTPSSSPTTLSIQVPTRLISGLRSPNSNIPPSQDVNPSQMRNTSYEADSSCSFPLPIQLPVIMGGVHKTTGYRYAHVGDSADKRLLNTLDRTLSGF